MAAAGLAVLLFLIIILQSETKPQVPELLFPKQATGLSRMKRDLWDSPITIPENQRAAFPIQIGQKRSSGDKSSTIHYSITGPGADQDPVGLFIMDSRTGALFLTRALDREVKDHYLLLAHAVTEGSGNAEELMDIVVNVIDLNDNAPVFTNATFLGEVPEASPIGSEVIRVVATDADQPDTANSELRYSIVGQDPELPSDNLFVINPVTGWIRVNAGGLDREKNPNYTLTVQAADLSGDGLIGEAKVILTVTDSAPVITQPSPEAELKVPVIVFRKRRAGLKRRKRDSVLPDINVPENYGGPYPIRIASIHSSEDKTKKIHYNITGPGATEDPVGLFFMNCTTGNLYLTKPLDRETQDQYKFQAYAVAEDSGLAEEPMDIVVNVIDQNDNKPVFTKDTFLGEVPEASPVGFEVIQVVATDMDQPNTDNSDLQYRIVEQDPDNLFVINPVTGWIRVNAAGLDREKNLNYTLRVEAADSRGEGLAAEAKVILTVTDRNDQSSLSPP